MKRILTLLCLSFVTTVLVVAQQGQVFELRTADGGMVAQAKMAYAAMLTLDPEAKVSGERDRLKVRLAVQSSAQAVIETLAQHGAGEFVLVTCSGKMDRVGLVDNSTALPPLAGDFPNEEQHAAAKQQWAEQHPDAHQRYIRSMRSTTPVSHE